MITTVINLRNLYMLQYDNHLIEDFESIKQQYLEKVHKYEAIRLRLERYLLYVVNQRIVNEYDGKIQQFLNKKS